MKKGDKVIFNSVPSAPLLWSEEMNDFVGKVMTVKKVFRRNFRVEENWFLFPMDGAEICNGPVVIKIKSVTNSSTASETEHAITVRELVREAFKSNNRVLLDFEGIDFIDWNFSTNVISAIYDEFGQAVDRAMVVSVLMYCQHNIHDSRYHGLEARKKRGDSLFDRRYFKLYDL